MSKIDFLRLSPIPLNETAWYYEEPKGITVVQEKRNDQGRLVASVQTTIPWRKVRASLKRKDMSLGCSGE